MKRKDFLACFIIEMSSSEMSAKLETQDSASSSKFSEIDGQKSAMSNAIKQCLVFSSMLANHSMTVLRVSPLIYICSKLTGALFLFCTI